MSIHELEEANRCLQCKKPMCREGCPIHTNIPEMIRLFKENDLQPSAKGIVSGESKELRYIFPLLRTTFLIPASTG